MRAVEINKYGAARDVIEIRENASKPTPNDDQLLVRVIASSVNPIDCAVRSGYGRELFKRQDGPEFPIRLGRDISGRVEAVGKNVQHYKPGDEIWAATLSGATADYAVVDTRDAAFKPRNLSFEQAAALPYVALTTWSALVDHVGLSPENTAGKRVIIPRGAGGVGCFAIQLMKAWGAEVATICSTRNVDLVKSLGADTVVDYKKTDFGEVLHDYDVAYDTSFDTEEKLLATLKKNANASYVSIVTPKIHFVDEFGVKEGLERADALFKSLVAEQRFFGRSYYWSFMQPNGHALATIAALVEDEKINPVIDRVYSMDELVEAHEYCESKQAQGKIIVKISDA